MREPAREATFGFMEALEHPPPDARLANDLHTLLQRYVERALRAGPPKEPAEMMADITGRVMDELAARTPEQRRIVAALVREAVVSAIAAADRGGPAVTRAGRRLGAAVEQTAGGAGMMFTRGAIGEMRAQIEPEVGEAHGDPLIQGLAHAAEQTAEAATRGAVQGLRTELAARESRDGRLDWVQAASRSATMGALEGIRHATGLWSMALAFLLGGLVTGACMWLVRALKRRPLAS
ncbi:Hypothetical protein A7982_02760 [Minicystis rosea]|nr:Hypothetical protein A7982_02760 [Minicystis rosea]